MTHNEAPGPVCPAVGPVGLLGRDCSDLRREVRAVQPGIAPTQLLFALVTSLAWATAGIVNRAPDSAVPLFQGLHVFHLLRTRNSSICKERKELV